MKYFDDYKKVIAIKERSAGNAEVGDMWIETASFQPSTPIKEIIKWAEDCSGKLIITIDESEINEDAEFWKT
jgi:hypothetical protein